jgi:hypothetical protein
MLRALTDWFRSNPHRPTRVVRRARLGLESLEERAVPTIVFSPNFGAQTISPGSTNEGLKSPPVYLVFWGQSWGTLQGQANETQVVDATRSILGGPYLTGLQQYGSDGKASFGAKWDVGSVVPFRFSTTDLQATVNTAIKDSGGVIPDAASPLEPPIYVVVTDTSVNYAEPGVLGYNVPTTSRMHMIWVGSQSNSGPFDLDRVTTVLSHELVETITDPDGNGIHVEPPATLPYDLAAKGINQIGDNEPDGLRYGYRLDGYRVQPYWSKDHKAFIVPDQPIVEGQGEQLFYLAPLWDGTTFKDQYHLSIYLDPNGVNAADQLTLGVTDKGGVQATLNGETVQFDSGVIADVPGVQSGIEVAGGSTTNTVLVQVTPANVSAGIYLNSSRDTVDVGVSSSVQGIAGEVTVYGANGAGKVVIDDRADPTAHTNVGITPTYVGALAPADIAYSGVATVEVDGGPGDVAWMYDGPGSNTFLASPKRAYFTGTGYANEAVGFGKVIATAKYGSNDVALLYGSTAGDDVFVNNGLVASSSGNGYVNEVVGFQSVSELHGGPSVPGNLAAVANQLTHSDESYRNFITQAYLRYLGRQPDAPGLAGWLQAMRNGLSDEQLEAGFIGSAEYIADHGGQGAGWVIGMYHDLLGRAPAQAEVDGWVNALNNGTSPTQVAYGFAASAEREGIRVNNDYLNYLGRPASSAEVAGWVSAFENGTSNENVIAGFVGSPENFGDHDDCAGIWIEATYLNVLGRPASASELHNWIAVL